MAYLRHFHNLAHCTMVPTEALRRDLDEVGYRRLQVVSRGVDTAQFGPHRRSELLRRLWGAGPQDLVVISVGRLAAEKNLELLLSAFEERPRLENFLRDMGVLTAVTRGRLFHDITQLSAMGIQLKDTKNSSTGEIVTMWEVKR